MCNQCFLWHNTHGFDHSYIVEAYSDEERKFLANVNVFPRSAIKRDVNIICSHTLSKIKLNYDTSFKHKDRIAPHDNEDEDHNILHTECCMCPPMRIRIVNSQ